MRLVVGALLVLLVVACDPFGKLPAGEEIDGIVVGAGGPCQDGADPGFCRALLKCAIQNEFGGTDPGVVSWQMHGTPGHLRDGTLVVTGGAITIVVFELADGTRRATQVAETDRCR